MKKLTKFLLLPVLFGAIAFTTGCDGDAENAGEKMDKAADEAGDSIRKGAEETKDAVKDAADKVKDKVD